jgi:hypothetical protein
MIDQDDVGGVDPRFEHPGAHLVAGVSQCGKTTLVINLLRLKDWIFKKDDKCKHHANCGHLIQNILWYYHQWQPSYESFKGENIVKEWIPKLPTQEEVLEKTLLYKDKGGSIIVIDDFAQELNKDTANIFSILVHHTNTTVYLLTQNIFPKNPAFRDISLNATYIYVFKNPRDGQQIVNFAKQVSPGNNKFVVESYKDATKKAHSYLMFDAHQSSSNVLRLRSNILGIGEPPILYFLPDCI